MASAPDLHPASPPPPAPIVSSIEVRTENVFSEGETTHRFLPYGLLNALHRTTRPWLIRQELSIQEGDTAHADDLAESERILRHLHIFREVTVTADSDTVVVRTADSWTTKPTFGISSHGGVVTGTAGVEDRNFLGTCRTLEIVYDQGEERTSRSLSITDPGASIPHTTLALSVSDYSDGWNWSAGLARPFQRFEDRVAASGSVLSTSFIDRAYSAGQPYAMWQETDQLANASVSMRVLHSGTSVWRAGVAGDWENRALSPGGIGAVPSIYRSSRYLYLSLHLEHDGRYWIKRRNVDELDRDEDFNLSPRMRLTAGASPGLLDTRLAGRLAGSVSAGGALGSGFAMVSAAGESRCEDGWRQTVLTAEARTYTAPAPRTTLSTRVAGALGRRLDAGEEIALDGDHGIRAYRLHAATGTSRIVGNVEARTRLASDVLHVVSVGTAVFWDGGVLNGPPDGSTFLTDVGAGLRLGLTRASTHTLVRFDVARALTPDPSGWQGWLVSFATGQAF